MSLIEFDEISLELAGQKLLTEASFQLREQACVCLVGRNGAGKSTLFKLITGELEADAGEIRRRQGLKVSQLVQNLPTDLDRKVSDVIYQGLAARKSAIDEYEALASVNNPGQADLDALEQLQGFIESQGGWDLKKEVDTLITQLKLPAEQTLADLSGGWQRRVMLGQALVSRPDLLLLDEPTNHLDISTIEWLEHVVRGFPGSVLFITHDRHFLQKLANEILELDRGCLTAYPGDFKHYLAQKEKSLADEAKEHALFDKRLAQEEAWIRQGIKARRTRNEGRVRALEGMRAEHAARIKPQGKAKIAQQASQSSGKKVIEAKNLSFGYGDASIIDRFSIKIRRGDRIGILGNNGVGKSTLLNLLLGQLKPSSGTLKLGTGLEIAYFSQTRAALDLEQTVAYNVGAGRDYIKLNGKDRHVVGYLKDFLFTPERSLTPVKALSGGERNRVLLAKIFTQPANLLILDEPTNDLDVEMLEALEERLLAYDGTLLLVSHDRHFLDHVVTSTLVFESVPSTQATAKPSARLAHYVGGYSDWLRHGHRLAEFENPDQAQGTPQDTMSSIDVQSADSPTQTHLPEVAPEAQPKVKVKLSYQLQREFDGLEGKIESLEAEVNALKETIETPEFYEQPYAQVQQTMNQLTQAQQNLDDTMNRWLALDALQRGD